MVNTDYGRDLLCIPKSYPKIVEISKRHIKSYLGYWNRRHYFLSDFRIGAKWANVIRFQWKEFQKYAQEYYRQTWKLPIFLPVAPIRGYAYVEDTFFPDPSPETTSVDGSCLNNANGSTWSTEHDRASVTAGNAEDSNTELFGARCDKGADPNFVISRSFTLFDTSSIPDGNTIDSSTYSLFGFAKNDQGSSVAPVQSSPASDTAIVGDDMDAFVNLHSDTVGATAITIAAWSTTAYNDFTLNATGRGWISKTGISKFGFRQSKDYSEGTGHANAPTATASDYAQPRAADTAGTGNDPKLVVNHSVAGGATLFNLMGVGN